MAKLTAEEKTQRQQQTAALLATINKASGVPVNDTSMAKGYFEKAGVKVTTNPATNEVKIDGKPAADYTKPSGKTAIDMQKKKEDRIEAKSSIDSAKIKKDRAEKALSDFDKYEDYDATDTTARKQYDAKRKKLEEEALRAGEEYAVKTDKQTIDRLSEDDMRQLEQYAVNQIRDQNMPVELQNSPFIKNAEQEAAGLIDKVGKQRADELAETLMREENAKLAEQAEGAGRKFAEESPGWASAATVPINIMSAIVGTVGQLQGAARATGRYRSLDANETGTALDKYSGAIRCQVAQTIEGEDPGFVRKAGSLLYQGGMSFIDTTARMLASGGSSGVASAIAAMGGFSSALQKYSAMGASPERAALAATASAGLEYITEKLPTDEVLKIFRKGGSTSAVKEVLKQAFLVEPLGEEVNLFAGIAAEALILGEKSGKAQRIGDLIAGGMTRAEAEKQFWKETFAEAAQTYAVSAVAGGLGAGSAAIAGNQVQMQQEQQQTLDPAADIAAPVADGAEQVQREAQAPVLTDKDLVQLGMDSTVAGLQETAPAAAPVEPMTEHQQNLQMAFDDVMGGQEQTTKAVTNPVDSYPPEKQSMIRSYIQAVDTKIKDFVQKVKGGDTSFKRQKIADVNDRAASDIGRILDIDVNGFTHNINTNGVQHIINRHTGKPGGHDNSMELVDDIARIGWVLENYDNVELLVEDGEQVYSSEFRDKNDNPAPQIRFVKKIDGNYYVVEAACENKYNKLWVQSAYLQKNNGDVTQAPAEGPSANHETNARSALASPSPIDIVSENTQEVNGNSPTESDYYDEFEDFGTGGANREEFLGRDWEEVGKRNVKAYMYENPEVKPYFQMEAQLMLMELADSTKGERTYNEDVHYESGGEQGWSGVKRNTSEDIAYLLDTAGFSYAEIEKGLNAIIEDNGAENNAASKRIEFILHNRLMNGHKDFYGDWDTYPDGRVPASEEYIQLINDKQITTYDNEPAAVDDNLTASASNSDTDFGSPQTEDSRTMPSDGAQIPTKGEKDGQRVLNGFASSDFRNSNTYMNTGLQSENANIRKGYRQELRKNPDAAKYAVKHNADTLAEAERRTGSPENNAAALQDLLNREHWTPEDVATSTLLLDQIMASGDKAAIDQLNALRQKRKEAGTYSGQVAQSFAINNPTMKAADSPATAVDAFRSNLDGLKQEETTWSKKSGVDFETWKNQIKDDVDRIGIAIATVEDGDSDSMRQIIRQIAQRRGTTAWFGTSQNLTGNAWSVLKKLDFQDLKKVANTQLVAMADDYRARGAGEVAKGLRKQNMLSSLKTFVRNISGNVVGSFADSVSESGAGRMADAVLSKFTGKQTMGSDILRTGTYAKAAREAGQFASLCVELNIPIETDVDSSYSAAAGNSGNNKYLGKTFRATGNPAMRALYAYQKYMSYALEVTDKIFEGGTNAAVAESLNRLQGANLTEEEVGALADFTGNRRTFKNATWEEDGKTQGSELARFATSVQNLGGDTKAGKVWQGVSEVAMPFVSTPMNVAQTGIDYTAGVVKGLGEMVSIIKDAKAGKTIPVERQRQAASDFGRGVTGTAMIAMFASAAAMGALKVSNDKDWDKEALAQAEGRSGAQINWTALQRGMNGEDSTWKSGDIISGMDFLEPFNTQMYLGVELSQADDFNLLTGAGATIKSVWQSLMDSPVMTGLADIEQTLNDISEAESTEDAVNVAAGYAGDVASSYVPQFVRQIAQNQDGYYRDTRGENALDSAINSFMAAIPGQSEKLPIKYSGLGEAQQRGSAVETFLDPTATKQFQQNEVTTFLDELSNKVGEKANNIYPDRQAPMKFTYGNDWEVKLDGKMRETYQKTYGEKVNQLYTSLIHDKDFQGFSDELKIKVLEEAKGYATQYAKAAVSDYREAPIGTVQALAKGIVQREVKSQMDAFFTALDTQREYGYSTEQTVQNLDTAYDAFQDLSAATQKQILEDATSDTAKYLEVRAKGISTETFVDATERIGNLKIQPEFADIRPAQEFQVIAGMNISDSAKDILMKAWMEDYDPSVREKDRDTSELKYDYARNELGMSVAEYVDGYDIYTYEQKIGGEGTADRTRERMEKELDITKAEAKALYKLYGGKLKETLIALYG